MCTNARYYEKFTTYVYVANTMTCGRIISRVEELDCNRSLRFEQFKSRANATTMCVWNCVLCDKRKRPSLLSTMSLLTRKLKQGSPYYLPATVSAAFNFILPDHQLWTWWTILGIFVDGFETLSVEWRRSFAEGFFALSRRPLLRPRGDTESMTRESEFEKILTWEYFHEEAQEREWTDSGFSGLDWMAMVWSLHLSQQSGRMPATSRQEEAESQNSSGPAINEEFVFRALCKLLDAALPYQLIPIVPKLREFVQWFDDTEPPEYRRMISTRIREAVRMHEEYQKHHFFHKFHCMWYI